MDSEGLFFFFFICFLQCWFFLGLGLFFLGASSLSCVVTSSSAHVSDDLGGLQVGLVKPTSQGCGAKWVGGLPGRVCWWLASGSLGSLPPSYDQPWGTAQPERLFGEMPGF